MRALSFRPHPWHGIEPGDRFPEIVRAYIEIVPSDGVKYESDKYSGYLKVDRPQRFSSFCPTLYGFVPQTYCGERVAAHRIPGAPEVTCGDGDPLDICVLTDRPIARGEILLEARPIGGLRMVERREADDKIIAVLANDKFWEKANDVQDLPEVLVERLRHYFSTYKLVPGKESQTYIESSYNADYAMKVIQAAMADYDEGFGS